LINAQSQFWSKVAEKYDRVVDLQIGSKTRSLVRERLRKEGQLGNVAEFGCGTGYYTQVLVEKANRVIATDLSPGMLDTAKQCISAANVKFQTEDCQKTSLPAATFDTAFISLVLHFTEPERTLAEMHRILKPGGTLIIANLDFHALGGLDRARAAIRILYHGATGYRLKPPQRFITKMLTEKQLCELLSRSGFKVLSSDVIKDQSRSSNIPMEYIKAIKPERL
jgi:ubiquinone/menaquinone biosynthesis C-methylase UbiE